MQNLPDIQRVGFKVKTLIGVYSLGPDYFLTHTSISRADGKEFTDEDVVIVKLKGVILGHPILIFMTDAPIGSAAS